MDLHTAKSDSAGGTKSDSDNFPSQCPTYPSGTSPSLPPQIPFSKEILQLMLAALFWGTIFIPYMALGNNSQQCIDKHFIDGIR